MNTPTSPPTGHDPLCIAHDSNLLVAAYVCQCVIIRATRADERERLERVAATATITRNSDESLTLTVDGPYATGWVPVSLGLIADLPGAYNDGLARARADERERIAQAIEAMQPYGRPTAAVMDTLAAAARIARDGGRDE